MQEFDRKSPRARQRCQTCFFELLATLILSRKGIEEPFARSVSAALQLFFLFRIVGSRPVPLDRGETRKTPNKGQGCKGGILFDSSSRIRLTYESKKPANLKSRCDSNRFFTALISRACDHQQNKKMLDRIAPAKDIQACG